MSITYQDLYNHKRRVSGSSSEDLLSDNNCNIMNQFKQNNFHAIFKTDNDIRSIRLQVPVSEREQEQIEYVSMQFFNDTIMRLEQRIFDLEDRYKSRMNVENSASKINDESNCRTPGMLGVEDLSLIHSNKKMSQNSRHHNAEQSQVQKSTTPQREEFILSRLNGLDKKLKAVDMKIQKQNKDLDLSKREQDSKIHAELKKLNESHEKSKINYMDVKVKLDEQVSNQKTFLQHLYQIHQTLNENAITIEQNKELPDSHLKEIRLVKLEQDRENHGNLISEFRQQLNSLENDLIVMLKNFKDIMGDLLRLKIVTEDLKMEQEVM